MSLPISPKELQQAAQTAVETLRQTQESAQAVASSLSQAQRRNIQAVAFLRGLSTLVKHKKAAAISLAMNLAVFLLHAWPNLSDKYYDSIGAATHLTLAVFSVLNAKKRPSQTQFVNTLFSVVWITRLGSFLFTRILSRKKDTRFDALKKDFYSFMLSFTMQSIWCYVGQLPLLVSNSNEDKEDELSWTSSEVLGRALFVFGFLFEVVADAQKTAFNADPNNHGKFIKEGLWALSRHPNHFGEICLQFGIAISAMRLYKSQTDYLAFLSPAITTLLLTQVSGIPMLEKIGMQRWGKDPEYIKYINATPELVPMIF